MGNFRPARTGEFQTGVDRAWRSPLIPSSDHRLRRLKVSSTIARMSNKDRPLAAFGRLGGPACDDCAAAETGFTRRQTAFRLATELAAQGAIGRAKAICSLCGAQKNASWWIGITPAADSIRPSPPAANRARPWYWEGNIQSRIVDEWGGLGFAIESVVDTGTKEPGTDIVARSSGGKSLWVTVKGFPEKSACTQARHWFAGALMDAVLYRGAGSAIDLARVAWLRDKVPYSVFWVGESGTVRTESPLVSMP